MNADPAFGVYGVLDERRLSEKDELPLTDLLVSYESKRFRFAPWLAQRRDEYALMRFVAERFHAYFTRGADDTGAWEERDGLLRRPWMHAHAGGGIQCLVAAVFRMPSTGCTYLLTLQRRERGAYVAAYAADVERAEGRRGLCAAAVTVRAFADRVHALRRRLAADPPFDPSGLRIACDVWESHHIRGPANGSTPPHKSGPERPPRPSADARRPHPYAAGVQDLDGCTAAAKRLIAEIRAELPRFEGDAELAARSVLRGRDLSRVLCQGAPPDQRRRLLRQMWRMFHPDLVTQWSEATDADEIRLLKGICAVLFGILRTYADENLNPGRATSVQN